MIEKLKATVNEIAIKKKKLEEENLKLREDLKMYQNQCQVVMGFLFSPDDCWLIGYLGIYFKKLY